MPVLRRARIVGLRLRSRRGGWRSERRRFPKRRHHLGFRWEGARASYRSRSSSRSSWGGGALVAVVLKNLNSRASVENRDTAEVAKARDDVAPSTEDAREPTTDPKATKDAGTSPLRAVDSRPGARIDPRRTTTTDPIPAKPSASSALAPISPTKPPPTPSPAPPEPPPLPKNARASIGSVTTQGPIPLAEISSKLRSITGLIQSCYAKHLLEKPDEAGTLDMGFQVSGGKVRGAGARNAFFTGNLVSCVNRSFYTMSYAEDAGTTEVKCVVTLSSEITPPRHPCRVSRVTPRSPGVASCPMLSLVRAILSFARSGGHGLRVGK